MIAVRPVKAILVDLSGTLHIGNTALLGAVEALQRLRQTNATIKFVTNTTKESRRSLYERLVRLGFKLEESEIFSSLRAARDVVVSRGLNPLLLVDDEALEDFSDVPRQDGAAYDAVIVGLAPDKFNYEELNKAFRVLCVPGTRLIAIHEGRYYKREDGLALGPGAFTRGLAYAADCQTEVVGKPTANFFKAALGNIAAEHAVMIGDDFRDDIDGAQALGIRGFLVQTGKYRPGDEAKITPGPYRVCTDFPQAVELLLAEMVSGDRLS